MPLLTSCFLLLVLVLAVALAVALAPVVVVVVNCRPACCVYAFLPCARRPRPGPQRGDQQPHQRAPAVPAGVDDFPRSKLPSRVTECCDDSEGNDDNDDDDVLTLCARSF